jgi:hypothetical protein
VFTKFQHFWTLLLRLMKFLVKLCSLSKPARENLSDGIFRSVKFGVCLGVEYQPWSLWNLTPTDQKWEFSVHEQRFMNFMLMTVVLSGFEEFAMNEFSLCIFDLLIFMSKLMNMCLMRTQIFRWSDWQQHSQCFWCIR